jgi:hypothetical protein
LGLDCDTLGLARHSWLCGEYQRPSRLFHYLLSPRLVASPCDLEHHQSCLCDVRSCEINGWKAASDGSVCANLGLGKLSTDIGMPSTCRYIVDCPTSTGTVRLVSGQPYLPEEISEHGVRLISKDFRVKNIGAPKTSRHGECRFWAPSRDHRCAVMMVHRPASPCR